MPSERFLTALSRIEAAAQRLEAMAARAVPAAGEPDLADRHERLRAGTAEALARLDAMIAAQEGRG
jgi:hypothetical protein